MTGETRGRTARLARALARGLLCLTVFPMTTMSSACLIVSDPEFRGQDECTPSLLHHEAQPPTALPIPLGTSLDDQDFSASIPLRSCALGRTYLAHVFVDGAFVDIVVVPPTGAELRTVTVLLPVGTLDPRCHQVEVFVSSDFSGTSTQVPERAGDLAYVAWWFANDPDATFASCGK